MTILIHSDDDEKRADVEGVNSWHPMLLDDPDPLHVFTVVAAVLLFMDGAVWLIHAMFS
jgi:hypothetical protein